MLGGARGAANAAGAAFAAAAPEAALAAAAIGAIKDVVKGLKDFSEHLVLSNRHLADYNGRLASAYAQMEVATLRRDMDTAGRTSPSSEGLVRAVTRMQDSFHEYTVLGTTASNRIGEMIADSFSSIAEAFAPLVALVNMVAESKIVLTAIQAAIYPITATVELIKKVMEEIYEWLTGKKWAPAVGGAPMVDDLVRAIIAGNAGGAIFPGPFAAPRPL